MICPKCNNHLLEGLTFCLDCDAESLKKCSATKLKKASGWVAAIIVVIGVILFGLIGIVAVGYIEYSAMAIGVFLLVGFVVAMNAFIAWFFYHCLNTIGDAAIYSDLLLSEGNK